MAVSIDFWKDSAGLMGVATSACALVCNDSINRNDKRFRNRKHEGKDETKEMEIRLKRFLSLALAILMVFSMMPQITLGASAVNLTGGEKLYLKPGVWTADNAWFAAYFCNGSSSAEWIKMTDNDGDGVYEVTAPSGKNHKNVIFCRMNPASTSLDWNNKWNQTADLTYDGAKNCYTITGWGGDKSTGSWGTFTYPDFYVAGTNNGWTANGTKMTRNSDGTYSVTISNVTGELKFKVTDGTWSNAWGNGDDTDGNTVVKVTTTSNVTIKFNTSTKKITTSVSCVHASADLTTDEKQPEGCTTDGYKKVTCKCGHVVEDKVLTASGHDFSDNAELCKNNCGEKNPDYVPPHVHSYKFECSTECSTCEGGSREVSHNFGENEQYCTYGCGTENEDYVAPTEHKHDWSNKDGVCADDSCGAACEHDPEIIEDVESDCVNPGFTNILCKICGYEWTDDGDDATGHDFSDNAEFCKNGCGEKNPNYEEPSNVKEYVAGGVLCTLTEDGVFTITKIENPENGTAGVMCDYAANEDMPWYADSIRLSIKKLVVEEGVIALGERIFNNASNLESISLPSTLEVIGPRCFSNCTSLTEISLPDSVKTIGDTAFNGCTKLTEVDISNTQVTKLGKKIFSACKNLKVITLPKITAIGESCFGSSDGAKTNSLVRVNFKGTADDWDNINVNPDGSSTSQTYNKQLKKCTIYCTDGVYSVDSNYDTTAYTGTYTPVSDAPLAWTVNGTTLELMGWGITPDFEAGKAPWASSAASLTAVTVDKYITGIGSNAFSGCQSLNCSYSGDFDELKANSDIMGNTPLFGGEEPKPVVYTVYVNDGVNSTDLNIQLSGINCGGTIEKTQDPETKLWTVVVTFPYSETCDHTSHNFSVYCTAGCCCVDLAQLVDGATYTCENAATANYVAKIGETGYETFEAAMAAAQSGDTITVLSTVEFTEDITFNLPGVTIEAAPDVYLVQMGGKMTIQDGIFNVAFQTPGNENASVSVSGGTFNSVVYFTGSVSISGGTFNQNMITAVKCTDMDITGGVFNSTVLFGYVTTTISGGTFNGSIAGNYGVCSITGGTFKDQLGIGSYENCIAEGYEQVQNADGTWTVVKAAKEISGTITGCLIDLTDPAETFIASEIKNLYATESVVIKLFSGETQIATTTLLKPQYFEMANLGVKIIITGDSSSWKTVWAEGMPRADLVPDKVVLFVDGKEMNSANVPMISTNGEKAVNWAEVPGVNPDPNAPVTYQVATLAELKAAVAAAKDGDTILMTADITSGEQLMIHKAVILDLGGFTLTTTNGYGGLNLKNGPTVKNGTLNHTGNVAAIKAFHVAAIEDLVIDVAYTANKTKGGIVIQENSVGVGSIKNVTIKGDGLTNGIETYNCGNATEPVIGSMENVIINAVGTAMNISAPCGTATNCSFTGGKTGIELWIKGTYSAELTLVGCTVEGGEQAAYVHDEFNSGNIQNNGELNLIADDATTFAATSGAPLTLTIARAENVDRTVIDKLIDSSVATIGDTYYISLQAAINAVAEGETITLRCDNAEDVEISKAVALDLNSKNATGSFVLTDPAATLTVAAELNVSTDVANYKVVYENGVYKLVELPNGSITSGYVSEPYFNGVAAIWGEATSNAKESFVIEIYAGETLIATTTLTDLVAAASPTWHAAFSDDGDTYWKTVWTEGHPNKDSQPTAVKLVIDGKIVSENVVKMSAPDGLNPIVWAELNAFKREAEINGTQYKTLEEAAAVAQVGEEIILLSDVALEEALTLPAGVIFNGNGKTVDGLVKADGDLTFAGKNTFKNFDAGSDNTITIGEGASLKVSGGRITVSSGNIFNITGTVADAKTADKSTIAPSLELVGGISFNGDGNGVQFNVTNAYVVLGDSTTKNNGATGEFNMNFTNSIVDFSKTLKTYMPTASGLAPVFNLSAKDSVVNFASHMELWLDETDVTLDNSNLTVEGSFANAGNVTVKNGAYFLVKAPIMSSHGGNTGVITVDGGTFELADSNEDWENAGTMTATGNGKIITNDFKNVGEGKLVISSVNASVVGKADLGVTTDIATATVKYDETTKTYTVELPDVAMVGTTKYKFIDEAIAAWTNGTTLTLLADVTLSDVIKLKSTENHTLNLGTFTMTAASGQNAIEITCNGRSSASYALTVNADGTNPGGITAPGKACIYYKKTGSTKDRPIIVINNGVFNGTYSINSVSNGNTNCPQFRIYGGTFNGNVNLTKNLLQVYGGTFNGWVNCTGDQNAYREIRGGSFKQWQFMTADNALKFAVGTVERAQGNGLPNKPAVYDIGLYIDDNGYLVVGGAIITEPGEKFEASAPVNTGASAYNNFHYYLKYSSAKDNGLYYTSIEKALADANVKEINVYVDTLDLTGNSFKGKLLIEDQLTVTFAEGTDPAWTVATNVEGKEAVLCAESVADGVVTCVYKVMKPVAQIGDKKYETFEEALNVVEDGGTITLLGATGSELKKELEFTKDISFTITGKAPEYELPVVTFQNATVTIKDAEIQIPELDARQNATINVIDSIVDGAGGDSIVKSYYNGAINISGSSVVYTMQVTTMGTITIADTAKLNATWQTNVYGNGMITVQDDATFATAALHLTGQDYSGRDNTDADRVGKPATVVVDGANFIVGNVKSAGGSDYSYNSGKGINIGTVAGKAAVLDIKNGANVNIYMAAGQTANIGADGTVNVDGSTFNVACRGEGNVTLANKGKLAVQGSSKLTIPAMTGTAVFVTADATLTDTFIGGNSVYAGYGANKTDSLELTISGSFTANALYVGNKYEHYTNGEVHKLTVTDGAVVNVGSLYVRPTCVATVTNATVNTGDLLVRGSMTVEGSTMSHKSTVSGGTGHWAVYEDDDATKTASLTLKNSVVSTNYLIVGSNSNSKTAANSNATLTVDGGSLTLAGNLFLQGAENFAGNQIDVLNGATVAAKKLYADQYTKLVIDAANLTAGPAPVTGNASEFAAKIEVINNEELKGGVQEDQIMLIQKTFVAKVGDKKFETFEAAIAAACADPSVTRIEILADCEETVAAPGETYTIMAGQNLTIGAAEDYTVSLGRVGGESFSIYLYESNSSLTIEENVNIEGLDIIANGFATTGNNTTISGSIKALSLKQWTSNGTITVTETGKVWLGYGDGQFDLAYGNGTVTVNGNGDKTTAQFKAGYSGSRGDGNTLNLNNTYFEAGAWFNVLGSNVTINVNNSLLTVSGGDASGKLSIGASNVVNVGDGSEVKAGIITGAGKIVIDAANLTAGAAPISGNASTFTGEIEVINNEELYAAIDENGNIVLVAYVAKIGEIGYPTFEAALNAVEDGQTITLIEGATGSELKKELEFTKDISFTITGNAPEYELPVITFQNATVTIKDAEILIPELDARQNATINVIDSTVYDAGGNSIVKSYYNGAINISGSSVVYTMQVTTMGYITVSDTAKLNATWQTNVYGNGMITVQDDATFATAALHLTGQDYSGRDNTDADRVGKPAAIVVDGADFIVGSVKSAGGSDYSYNSGKGINIGTVAGKAAVLDIKNGATVNIYMGKDQTANIGADGIVNVNGSTVNVACRGEGNVTLANNGTVLVSGASDIAATVTGNGWFYMNEATLSAATKLSGAKVGFINGTNAVVGSTINNGWFSVGLGQGAAATAAAAFAEANGITLGDVTVNVSENAVIGANGATYSGWIGSAYSADKTVNTYTLNVENSLAAFGYLHVSKDGKLNVKGHSTNKYTNDNANVDFYAGDFIINGEATFDGTDAWSKFTKMSVDHADGVLNIINGTNYEASVHNGSTTGTALKFWKAGKINVDAASTVEVDNATILVEGAELNIGGQVIANGDVTGDGIITLTELAATYTAVENLNVVTTVADHKVVYENGVYSVQHISYGMVAMIGEEYFETLAEAVAVAQSGDTIVMIDDATTESLVLFKGVTLDLNGYDVDVSGYAVVYAGNHIVDSATGGRLKGQYIMIDDGNKALPIYDAANVGYAFAALDNFREQTSYPADNTTKYICMPYLDNSEYELIGKGAEESGVALKIKATWISANGSPAETVFVITDELMSQFVKYYLTGNRQVFTLQLTGTNNVTDLAFEVYFESNTGVILKCN